MRILSHPSVLLLLALFSYYTTGNHGVVVVAWNLQPVGRRSMVEAMTAAATTALVSPPTTAAVTRPDLQVVTDPNTYSALAYAPPKNNDNNPLILVLHGAGRNDLDILSDLADPRGEHAGLIPGLISDMAAPSELLNNFAVLAPYSYGTPSFYSDPRSQLLDFLQWAITNRNTDACPLTFDPNRIFIFGFSDGATVAIELLTTRRFAFAGAVICSYGYSGKTLPLPALERLANIPMWIFHSADDVIFDVGNSDRLVKQLQQQVTSTSSKQDEIIRYSRYDRDPENLPRRVRGHSMGITASKSPQVYAWMLHVRSIG